MDYASFMFIQKMVELYSLLAGFLWGDKAVFALSFLGSQKVIPYFRSVFLAFFGMVFSDYFYFLVGKSKQFKRLVGTKLFNHLFMRVEGAVSKLAKRGPFSAMFYVRFTLGTRFLVVYNLGEQGIGHWRFLKAAVVTSFAMSLAMAVLGYLAGKGFTWIFMVVRNLPIAMTFFVIVFFVGMHFHHKAHKIIIEKHGGYNAKLSHKKRRAVKRRRN